MWQVLVGVQGLCHLEPGLVALDRPWPRSGGRCCKGQGEASVGGAGSTQSGPDARHCQTESLQRPPQGPSTKLKLAIALVG